MSRTRRLSSWSALVFAAVLAFTGCKVTRDALTNSMSYRSGSPGAPHGSTTTTLAGGTYAAVANQSWATASTPTIAFTASMSSGDRAQSKIWSYAGSTWTIMPTTSGTWLWRLQDYTWLPVLKIHTGTTSRASVAVSGTLAHVLLYAGKTSYFATLEYLTTPTPGYVMWRTQPLVVTLTLDIGVEMATLTKDSTGRLWIASDTASSAVVRSAISPYKTWALVATLASGLSATDVCGIVALPSKTTPSIGVFWSNQTTKRFGFRQHMDSAAVTTWVAAQVPGSGAAVDTVGGGMADAQFGLAVAGDATVYAVVKTKYNSPTYPQIGLLVRRPATGAWDNTLYPIDTLGVKPVITLDSKLNILRVAYAAGATGGDIALSESATATIAFGPRRPLLLGTWNDPSFSFDNADGSSVLLATQGTTTIRGIKLASVTRGADVFVAAVVGETPTATTARLQAAITSASNAGAGVVIESGKTYDVDSELLVTYPGPTYIDGGLSTVRRVSGTGAVIRVASAQDGFTMRNLRVFASDGTYAEGATDCSITWAHSDAQYGVVLQNTRFATLRNMHINHASVAGLLISPTTGENEGTLVEDSMMRMNYEATQIIGTSTNHVRSTRFAGSHMSLMRNNGMTLQWVDDIQVHGGSIERAALDILSATDSTRLQFLTYFENFGGWAWRTDLAQWCPRSPNGNSIELNRVTNFLFRGRNGTETDRGTVGPVINPIASTCYYVASKEANLGQTCTASAVVAPTMLPRFEVGTPGDIIATTVQVLPSDPMTTVLAKFAQAATTRVGVSLQAGATYNWNPVVLTYASNTPAFLDGQGATINLVGVTGVEAMFKFSYPMDWINRDRFFIKDVTLNVGGLASYGVMIQGGVNLWLRRVTVNNAALSGIRAEGRPGSGFYYSSFRDITINNAPNGLDIASTTTDKYTNANYIENIITNDVGTVFKHAWVATSQIFNTKATWTPAFTGTKLLLNADYTSDVEMRGITLTGATIAPTLFIKTGWSVGLYYDNTLI